MGKLEIKDWYEHEHSQSIFIMFTKDCEVIWHYSGNELRQIYLRDPEEYLSAPIEVAIPDYVGKILTDYDDDFSNFR